MRPWFRGKRGGALIFVLIATLVAGGLGWATVEALRLEREQVEGRAQAEQEKLRVERERLDERARAERTRVAERELDSKFRLALSLLDSRVLPVLVQEENRPYNDYSAVFASPLALVNTAGAWRSETVLEPSPLVSEVLPDWVVLHFQAGEDSTWGSPQVLTPSLAKRFTDLGIELPPATGAQCAARSQLCVALTRELPPRKLLALVEERSSGRTTQENTLVPGNPIYANNSTDQSSNPTAGPPVSQQLEPQKELPKQEKQPGQGLPGGQYQAATQSPGVSAPRSETANQVGDYGDRSEKMSRAQRDSQAPAPRIDQNYAIRNSKRNGEEWFSHGPVKPGGTITISRGPLIRLWLKGANDQDMLVLARQVQVGDHALCQGLVLNWERLQEVLAKEIVGLFPQARFLPMREPVPPHPERTMSALPIELDAGVLAVSTEPDAAAPDLPEEPVPAVAALGWTPLRVGLGLAWTAALVALVAVGLGGWSLLDLSERRIRFVSAVTHELRTPMTTLRLYLDMLSGGLVTDERQKTEYFQTLDSEADRLNRLIGNVLDFSRLENQRPRLHKAKVELAGLLEQVHVTWARRCQDAGKELVLDNSLAADTVLETDLELVQQVLGNLIDNACKYSREAQDQRVWLRARREGRRQVFEVEDRGPGVAPRERRAIFRPFRRGRDAEVIAGGVGLGLALAQRWAGLLGGSLAVNAGPDGAGACFRLELPA